MSETQRWYVIVVDGICKISQHMPGESSFSARDVGMGMCHVVMRVRNQRKSIDIPQLAHVTCNYENPLERREFDGLRVLRLCDSGSKKSPALNSFRLPDDPGLISIHSHIPLVAVFPRGRGLRYRTMIGLDGEAS